MTDASMARPGVDDDGDVGLVVVTSFLPVFDVGEVAAGTCGLSSLTVVDDSPALARRCRSSRRGLGAICGRGRGEAGDATDDACDVAVQEVGAW